MVERAHCVLVPVVPSIIDIRATENFIGSLLAIPKVRSGDARVGIVANKVRVSMPAYQPFLRFLEALEVKVVARVLDSDVFLRAAESGLGIFEMDPGQTAAERKQFQPIVEWISRRGGRQYEDLAAAQAVNDAPRIRRVSF